MSGQLVGAKMKQIPYDPDQFVMRKPWQSGLFIALGVGGFVAAARLMLACLALQALLPLGLGIVLTLCAVASLRWRLRADGGGLHLRRLCGPERSVQADEIDRYLLISAPKRHEIRVYALGGLFEIIPLGATNYHALENWLQRHASGELLLTPVQSFTIPPSDKRK
jgi:hypothetical protein